MHARLPTPAPLPLPLPLESPRFPAPRVAFRGASLASLRLLAGFALFSEETAPGREALLSAVRAEDTRPCLALLRTVAGLQASGSLRGTLDGVLAAALASRARTYRRRTPASLAGLWQGSHHRLEGPDLAALLWWVARSDQPALRPLERAIAQACDSARLLRGPLDPGACPARRP